LKRNFQAQEIAVEHCVFVVRLEKDLKWPASVAPADLPTPVKRAADQTEDVCPSLSAARRLRLSPHDEEEKDDDADEREDDKDGKTVHG
jgi:hypothetical protein